MSKAPNRIGAARREYMKREGVRFTQEDAAREFGVSLSAYRNYEQEVNLPNAGTISKIANKFGVSVDYLLYKSDDPRVERSVSLTHAERRLVQLYRESSEFGRKRIVQIAESICAAFPDNGQV